MAPKFTVLPCPTAYDPKEDITNPTHTHRRLCAPKTTGQNNTTATMAPVDVPKIQFRDTTAMNTAVTMAPFDVPKIQLRDTPAMNTATNLNATRPYSPLHYRLTIAPPTGIQNFNNLLGPSSLLWSMGICISLAVLFCIVPFLMRYSRRGKSHDLCGDGVSERGGKRVRDVEEGFWVNANEERDDEYQVGRYEERDGSLDLVGEFVLEDGEEEEEEERLYNSFESGFEMQGEMEVEDERDLMRRRRKAGRMLSFREGAGTC
ncbi:hypothetical protein G7Y89_g8918 [Cudoniella acicularis]|uniref:Uncharacterized protein n=1 Tax=Cudoniella acicularis TaxID=354080 RepID=A0A8H4W052_9HELO|nr:hypothetical protein G7Y89_g8918 [Cudoniella acicularis]